MGENLDIGLTEYVVTRYYRAPEIMLTSHKYTKKIDIWSVGCTLAELITKKHLFPGEDYLNQIKLIIQLLGTPVDDDLYFIGNGNAKDYVKSFKIPKIVNININISLLRSYSNTKTPRL